MDAPGIRNSTRPTARGLPAELKELQKGQSCEITYAGDKQDAIRIACK
ncbi:MAG TPA: hypothetical protein VL966_17490 [Alphaproteobacteria bacterium]|jgi:hypothetical protein|nr:hypothetical protein [Alphaproteobacteria bacterium]